MNAANQLRQLLARPEIVVAPGAYDGLTARLIQQAGFAAVYMTGAGTAAARGFPDFGLLGMSEMVDNAAVIARSADIPLIADADTGYGNELNVTRTVREFEARTLQPSIWKTRFSPSAAAIWMARRSSSAMNTSPRSERLSPRGAIRISRSSPAPTHAPSSASTRPSSAPIWPLKRARIWRLSKRLARWRKSRPFRAR